MADDEFLDAIIELGPEQGPITEDRIREMVNWSPRRMKLAAEWKSALHAPHGSYRNWSLVLPFPETFQNSFQATCGALSHYASVGKGNRCIIFLNDSEWNEESVDKTKEWIVTIENHVVIRDCLSVSFALDYRVEGGDPKKARTLIGDLCRRAKPYQGDRNYDKVAAKDLANECVKFLRKSAATNASIASWQCPLHVRTSRLTFRVISRAKWPKPLGWKTFGIPLEQKRRENR